MFLCLMLSTTSVSAAPKINKKTATVYVNKTITLRINGAKRKVKWRSSNAKIASVNKNGVVRGKRAGKAKITGYLNGKRYVCRVTVKKKKNNPKLNYSNIASSTGRVIQLKLLHCKSKVSWSSSNAKVASVSRTGKARFKNSGVAYIYAKTGKKRYKCIITVFDRPLGLYYSSMPTPTPTPKLKYDIKKAAPKAEQKILDIFNATGFKLKYRNIGNWTYGLTSTYDYDKSITLSTELFDTSKRIWKGSEQITLENVTYHELGHFVAWITDRSDLTNKMQQLKKEEDKRHTENEKHKKDLMYLKKIVRSNLSKEDYKNIFVNTDAKLNNYCAYVGMTKKNGRKVSLAGKCCSQIEFYDFLKKNVLSKIDDTVIKEYLENEINCENFLPKQINKGNSVIPYQVHLFELKSILKNMEAKIPFIRENSDKIIQLFEFRIPYYVGPLCGESAGCRGKFSWAVRKSYDKIYPWNFNDVIDTESSAEVFIRRMTNKCTYLAGEDVLPKDSLLYSKFMVLNELNNVKLNGASISPELKQKIYTDVFCRCRKVTQKKLRNYLVCEGIADRTVDITGIDGDFKASLNSFHDFKEKLTGAELNQQEKEMIILNIVLFGEDKKLLKQRLKKLFPKLTEGQMKAICTLSYKGWGKLSKKFLEEVTVPDPETGEFINIITALWKTNDNLMQLLYGPLGFMKYVEDYNSGSEKVSLDYESIENLYVSPAVKRQIWQTLKVVKEIRKCMGTDPKRIFVEMAREKQESKRTESRKKQLLDLYRNCKEEQSEIVSSLEQREDHELRRDKLYLYYTQKGRCMYSGRPIDFEKLWDNNMYDIDHIYPQSRTMDDSLDNRVLVERKENELKEDIYPINPEIQKARKTLWKSLLDGGFISKKKYERLVRTTKFDENELAGFIERQIVETRQGTKIVADILKEAFPNSTIVYVKARTVSNFRQDFELMKVHEMNDLHHAKDAYLNIVVGNSYYVKFTQNAAWYIKENPGRTYNLEEMFKPKKRGRVARDIVRNGEIAWKAGEKGTIITVKKVMQKNNILVTRRSYEVKGGLFDQMIMKKGKGQIPIKSSDGRLLDINKYGGYNKATGAYFMLVKSRDKKGREIRSLEFVPLYLKNRIEQNEDAAIEYLEKDRGLKEPQIVLRKIRADTLFDVDGFKMWLSGRSGSQLIFKCANQLILSPNDEKCLKKILKFIQRRKENKNLQIYNVDGILEEDLLRLYDTFLDKLQNTMYKKRLSAQVITLTEKRNNFIKLRIEDKCIVLNEILHMFQSQSGCANLTLIGGPAKAGRIAMNSNITECKSISIINQSSSGIFEKKIDLLKL